MRNIETIVIGIMLALPCGMGAAPSSPDGDIAEAVSPLPESLRAGATVITYDHEGNPKVLRKGDNGVVCSRDWPLAGHPTGTRCYGAALAPQHDMIVKLLAEGKTHEQASAAVKQALESGKLKAVPPGTMSYTKSADGQIVWMLHLPKAKAEALGVPTKAGNGSPWMMESGTPFAHVMVPLVESSLAAAPAKKR